MLLINEVGFPLTTIRKVDSLSISKSLNSVFFKLTTGFKSGREISRLNSTQPVSVVVSNFLQLGISLILV
jgi:hypothetical protein